MGDCYMPETKLPLECCVQLTCLMSFDMKRKLEIGNSVGLGLTTGSRNTTIDENKMPNYI